MPRPTSTRSRTSSPDRDDALAHSVFAASPTGPLGAAFHLGATATDAAQRILYDAATGALRYDPDGNAGAAATQFATLAGMPAISHQDFVVT